MSKKSEEKLPGISLSKGSQSSSKSREDYSIPDTMTSITLPDGLLEMERIYQIMKREMRCPSCGVKHPNPALKNIYRYCYICNMILAEPEEIEEHDPPASDAPLQILIAAYGHPTNPLQAVDCTQKILRRVEGRGARDRLVIRQAEDLRAWLGDPCPGQSKVLRIRYSIKRVRSEVWLKEKEDQPGHVQKDLDIRVPTRPAVVVLGSAFYGHPRGQQNGRWCFNVKEFLQARLDESGGYNIQIGHNESLEDIFGEPSMGRSKDLVMNYEIIGTAGKAECQVVDGCSLTNISIKSTPILMPMVVIHKATYGLSEIDSEEQMRKVYNELIGLVELERRAKKGDKLSYAQQTSLKTIHALREKLAAVSEQEIESIEVSQQLQRIIEGESGRRLILEKDGVDINQLFGYNPCPGFTKYLRLEYSIMGHDSENITSSDEITSSGYQRNFISSKKGSLVVKVDDDKNGKGILSQDIRIEAEPILNVIEINAAVFGHPKNLTKCFDVGSSLRFMVQKQGGNVLEIPKGTDLVALFRDPCRGVRKRLFVSYVARGLNGTLRVAEKDGFLVTDVFVGHPTPNNEADDRSIWTMEESSITSLQPSLDPKLIPAFRGLESSLTEKDETATFATNSITTLSHVQSAPTLNSRQWNKKGIMKKHGTLGSASTQRRDSLNSLSTLGSRSRSKKKVRIKQETRPSLNDREEESRMAAVDIGTSVNQSDTLHFVNQENSVQDFVGLQDSIGSGQSDVSLANTIDLAALYKQYTG